MFYILSNCKNQVLTNRRIITTNFYRVDTTAYKQLLTTSITKAYKKAPPNTVNKINSQEKSIAEDLNLANRIDALAEKIAFVTLKDHKPNFTNNPTCRLINPSKSKIGIVSKKILERINSKVVKATGINQWKDTDSVNVHFCKNHLTTGLFTKQRLQQPFLEFSLI